MNNKPPLMTHLEDQLKSDTTGGYQQEILGKLSHEGLAISRFLNQGCKPAEYQKLTAAMKAVESAELIIKQVARELAN